MKVPSFFKHHLYIICLTLWKYICITLQKFAMICTIVHAQLKRLFYSIVHKNFVWKLSSQKGKSFCGGIAISGTNNTKSSTPFFITQLLTYRWFLLIRKDVPPNKNLQLCMKEFKKEKIFFLVVPWIIAIASASEFFNSKKTIIQFVHYLLHVKKSIL